MTRVSRRLALAALMLVSAAVPVVFGEAVLRVLAAPPNTPGLFALRSDDLEYFGRPYAEGLISGAPVRLNRTGLRDRDHEQEPPGDRIRIVALGDSITFGQGVKENDTFPRVAEALLNRSRPSGAPRVEILNFGIPGYNTLHEVALLKQVGFDFHPDIVVVGFLYNDLEISPAQRLRLAEADGVHAGHESAPPSSSDGSVGTGTDVTEGRGLGWSRLAPVVPWLKQRSQLFAWVSPRVADLLRRFSINGIGRLGENDSQFVDANKDWRLVQATLLEAKRLCDDRGIRLVIMIIPAMTNFSESAYPLGRYHRAVSDFCRSSSILCLDLLPAFAGVDGTRLWISPTDAHPNAEGDRIIGETLGKFLESHLEELPRLTARPAASVSNNASRNAH